MSQATEAPADASSTGGAAEASPPPPDSLHGFVVRRVLSESAVLGHFGDEVPAVVLLGPLDWGGDKLGTLVDALRGPQGTLQLTLRNNEYAYYQSPLPGGLAQVRVEVIRPALPWHIAKYSTKQVFLVQETPHLFDTVTAPYIEALPPKKLAWVFDILDGKKESDRVLCGHPDPEHGYLCVRHPSWTAWQDPSQLCYVAIARRRTLRSLRDVDGGCVAMLRNMRAAVLARIEAVHGLSPVDVKAFFHYQPSFFQLHVHFKALGAAEDPTAPPAREVPLGEVLDNLAVHPNYYQRRTLPFSSGQHPALATAVQAASLAARPPRLLVVHFAHTCTRGVDGAATAAEKRPFAGDFLRFCRAHFARVAVLVPQPSRKLAQEHLERCLDGGPLAAELEVLPTTPGHLAPDVVVAPCLNQIPPPAPSAQWTAENAVFLWHDNTQPTEVTSPSASTAAASVGVKESVAGSTTTTSTTSTSTSSTVPEGASAAADAEGGAQAAVPPAPPQPDRSKAVSVAALPVWSDEEGDGVLRPGGDLRRFLRSLAQAQDIPTFLCHRAAALRALRS